MKPRSAHLRQADMALRSAHESARRINEERRAKTKEILKREGCNSVDEYIKAAQARLFTRGQAR